MLAPSEYQIQRAIVDLLAIARHRDLICWHTPNGEDRHARVGAKLRLMGVLPGVPDLCFVLPSGRAAFIEVKAPKGKLSPEQMAFQLRCATVGAPYAVVRSLDEAVDVLTLWGALKAQRAAA